MARVLSFALIFLCACSNNSNNSSVKIKEQFRFYDYEMSIEFLNPFLGVEKSFSLTSDTLTLFKNTFSDEGGIIKTDTSSAALTKPQLDSIYNCLAVLFTIDKENLTREAKPHPPSGEGNMVRVSLDLNLRGDKYTRDIRKVNTFAYNFFSRLNDFVLEK